MKKCILVPIKTNNRRLPGKTMKLLAGKPLYAYLFDTLKKVKCDGVYVDSSDDQVLKIAKEYGFNTFKRPEEFNGDNIAGDHLINRVIDNMDCDVLALLHITSPFLSVETIEKAFDTMEEDKEIDSLFGVKPVYNRHWYQNKPLNHDPNNLKRTQDLEPVYVEAADMYFVKKEAFKKYGRRVCGNWRPMNVSDIECTDIDTITDFLYAEALVNNGLVR